MKGKISLYFNAPNTAKVRSRLQTPSKELSSNLRQAINEAIAEVVNENILAVRAKLIEKFSKMGETPKDKQKALELGSVLNPYFDVVVSMEKFADADETEEATEEAAEEQPAETQAPADEFED